MTTYHIPADTNVIRYTTRGIREHALTRFPVTYTDMELVAQSMNQDGKAMVYRFRIPVAQYSWLWIEVDAHLVIVSTILS